MGSISYAETVIQQHPQHIDSHPDDDWNTYIPDISYPMSLVFNDASHVDPNLSAASYTHILTNKQHVESFASFPTEHVQVPPQVPSQEEIAKTESPLDAPQNDTQPAESPAQSVDPKAAKKASPPAVDPFAAGYLREVLGDAKWNIFSARLFERRLTGPRRSKKPQNGENGKVETTASLIDFLCKAEAVKEVLRTYVPHPYNPHKTLTHAYARAPTGRVTLSRSTVLALSGWSNTQFSYWARRSEAIGVLAYHDRRLKSVAIAFHARLRGSKIADEVGATEGITGKGLDAIVEEVKARTGASPFIRGKHSCLDPFTITDVDPQAIIGTSVPPWAGAPQGVATEYTATVGGYVPTVYQDGNSVPVAITGADVAATAEVTPVTSAVSYYIPPQLGYPTVGTHFQITEPAHYANAQVSPVEASTSMSPVTIPAQLGAGEGDTAASPQTPRPIPKKRTRTKKAPAYDKPVVREATMKENKNTIEAQVQSEAVISTRTSSRKRKTGGVDSGGPETRLPPRKKAKRD